MSQTVRIYKSAAADARFKVRWGRKHGRPRGRGRKAWRLLYRVDLNPGAIGRADVEYAQRLLREAT